LPAERHKETVGLCFEPRRGVGDMKRITTDELRARMARDGLMLLDVRGDVPYENEHIPRSLSVPVDEIDERVRELSRDGPWPLDKEETIITYCGGLACPLSARAAEKLEEMGYSNVLHYAEGIAGWKEAGLRTEGSRVGGAIPRGERTGTDVETAA